MTDKTKALSEALDSYGRRIDYLRISVTDRCNFRCIYCMPEEGVESKCHDDILSMEEIYDFVKVAANHGVRRVRLTGGEPLVRKGVVELIAMINELEGIEDISLTTNGALLPKYADELRAAGLKRVNISLDTFDPELFAKVTRKGKLDDVLEGIQVALEKGFDPVKINVVAMRSLVSDPFEFARLSIDSPLHIRFIEFMPIGDERELGFDGWSEDESMSVDELRELINVKAVEAGVGELVRVKQSEAPAGAGPSKYYRFEGAQGTVGFISPISNHFCGACNRLRLTADGKLRPCLFSDLEYDVLPALREKDGERVEELIMQTLREKPDSHHFVHGTKRQMSQIGG